MAKDDFAIVVGIDQYDGFAPLQGAERDAAAFRDWLVQPSGGDVPNANIRFEASTVNGSVYEPGTDRIYRAFRPLVSETVRVGGGRAGRRFYGFFAGHGFSDPGDMDSNSLYTANAVPEVSPHVAATRCVEWFRRNSAFDEVVLVMDCCRSVSSLTAVVDPPFMQTRNANRASSVRRFYAFATQWGFESREEATQNGAVRGIFTSALLDVLTNIQGDASGAVMGQAVKNELHNHLKRVAPDAPDPEIVVDTNADICLIQRTGAAAANAAAGVAAFATQVQVTLAPFDAGSRLVVIDGIGKIVSDVPMPTASITLGLPHGLYKLQVVGTDRSQLIQVMGSAAEYTV